MQGLFPNTAGNISALNSANGSLDSGKVQNGRVRDTAPSLLYRLQKSLMKDRARPTRVTRPHHALVVDDEHLIRWSLSETLKDLGHTIVEAGDARTAILAAGDTRNPFDLVVLDLRLPDSDDLTLLTHMRQLMPRAYIILMTAHGSPELVQSALELGAQLVLEKPFGMTQFAEMAAAAVRPPVESALGTSHEF